MKKLLIGAAFIAMFATPALAQSFDPDMGTGNVNPPTNSLYGAQRYDSGGLTSQGARSRESGPYASVPDGSASGPQNYSNREDSDYPEYEPHSGR
jgi:hypothetical protein